MAKARPNKIDISDAAALAKEHYEIDPLPSLEPSLLSSAHIEYYVHKTGMMDSFDRDALKSASYEVPIRGKVIYWNEKRDRVVRTITDADETLKLEANSITFVQVEPRFRMPRYMAFRFNLRIHHVHRGLLLGTGPLVDPGFQGEILIPLHNLTATDYDLDLSKALIWIEFTKTSYGRNPPPVPIKEVEFREGARFTAPLTYLQNANGGFPILSSIPDAVADAAQRAEEAEKSAAKSTASLEKIRTFGLLALLTAVGGVAAIVFNSLTLSGAFRQDVENRQSESYKRLSTLEAQQTVEAASRSALEKEVAELKTMIEKLRFERSSGGAIDRAASPPSR